MKLQAIVILLVLIFCEKISAVDLCVRNNDYDSYCHTYFRFAPDHQFPDYFNTLLDSHSHLSLVGSKWRTLSVDGDSQDWTQRGGICQYDLRVCGFSRGEQNNWIFTHYNPYLEAKRVMVNITYRFSQCTSHPNCHNDFVNVYFYNVSSEPANHSPHTDPSSYGQPIRQLRQAGYSDNDVHWSFERPEDSVGFYLAFQDQGTCGQVRRVHIYYEMATGVRDDENLITCPCIARPFSKNVASISNNSKPCECDQNAMPVYNLMRSVTQDGIVSKVPSCACRPGYQLEKRECLPCPPGTFKASISNTDRCIPCPLNSQSLFEASEVCACDCNKVRPKNKPEADCHSPPSNPRLAVETISTFHEGMLKICWLPSKDDGGSPDTLHYNIYEYAQSTSEYKKMNTVGVTQSSGGINDTICYDFATESEGGVANVIVTSATKSTGDEESLKDTDEAKGRFIAIQVSTQGVVVPPGDPCTPNPCGEFATCTVQGARHHCTCTPPYEGDGIDCEIPDPCSSNPCGANEQCTQSGTGFTCDCRPPFVKVASLCVIPIPDPCSSSPCDPNAQCNRLSSTSTRYTCTCTPPYTGTGFSCQLPDPCSSSPCDPNAQCNRLSPITTRYTCTCTPPFTGSGFSCQLPDPCSSNPCGANEQCTQSGTGFTCDCRPPFVKVASLCVIPIPDPCSSSPCDQNAQCNRLSSTSTRYTCTCTPPYIGTGFSCRLPAVETTPPPQPPYFELGSTIYQDGATVNFADIAEGNDALLCKTPYDSCCQAPPKGEFYYPDGTLVPVRKAEQSTYRNRDAGFIRLNLRNNNSPPPPAGSYACEIPDGLGQTTKIYITILHSPVTLPPPADPCLSSPCDPNAQCNRLSPTSTRYTCTCTPPYTGTGFSCQLPDPCSSSPCDPNAQCNRLSPTSTRYTCTCTPPYTGTGFSCQLPDPCSSNPCGANEQCTQSGTGFTCDCRPPFVKVASLCVIPIPDPCSSSPCDPNAQCNRLSSTSTRYTCTCTPPYTGTGFSCRLPDPCLSSPCDPNAQCNRLSPITTRYTCTCTPPYIGSGFSCRLPAVETTPPPQPPYFELGSTIYQDGATVSFADIAEGDDALLCKTPYDSCCQAPPKGEFYYPDGTLVPVRKAEQATYRNRGAGFIRLNLRNNNSPPPPAGSYACEIPDGLGQTTKIYITLIHASVTPPPTTTEQIIRPFFKLRGTEYEHGAQVLIRRIGEGDNALKCVTQFEACCKQETIGEFYNPQNRLVSVKAAGGPLYRNRGEGYIRLNHRGNRGIVTAGEYCCEIPDISGELTRVCINLTN